MKRNIILILLVLLTVQGLDSYAQKASKPPIDFTENVNWPYVGNPTISSDGKYASYTLDRVTLIKEIFGRWKAEIETQQLSMTLDSKKAIYIESGGNLCILTLGSSVKSYYRNIASFKLSGIKDEILAMKTTNDNKLLVLNLQTGTNRFYTNVIDYIFSKNGQALLLTRSVGTTTKISYINFKDKFERGIWNGDNATNFTFDQLSKKVAFIGEHILPGAIRKSLWVYEFGKNHANLIIDTVEQKGSKGYVIDGILGFTDDEKNIFISQRKNSSPAHNTPNEDLVDIWSYNDHRLRSEQNFIQNQTDYRTFLVNIGQKKSSIVTFEDEHLGVENYGRPQHIFLITKEAGDIGSGEENWNSAFKRSYYLFDTKNGLRKQISAFDSLPNNILMNVSPDQKFIIFFNGIAKNYFSYEIGTGQIQNISKTIKTKWSTGYNGEDQIKASYYSKGIAGWIIKDQAILLYDRNDIWQVDPLGIDAPINLTNGYGVKNDIVFEMGLAEYSNRQINRSDTLLLSAFNGRTKENGFYHIALSKTADPEKLTMGYYMYSFHSNAHGCEHAGMRPIKAKKSNTFIVQKESTTESPNLFATNDFKNYHPISNNYPEQKYNWFTSELHTWVTKNGDTLQGVLYKPEDFDKKKKYPVILNYYQTKSADLNGYWKPEILTDGSSVNIPFYLSRGYLIFTPDIKFIVGKTGESALIAVESATDYLCRYPWVNKDKLGIQGCSFSGFTTNYIVTHSDKFAAACSASGGTDLVSYYGDLHDGIGGQQAQFETGQYRIGATLWSRPDLYIENSPIFQLHNVTTPLLLMSTKQDMAVPPSQAIEMFTGLRRLGKKVWHLRYKEGNHGVYGKEGFDFGNRMIQFFDFYLKDSAAPIWMLNDMPDRNNTLSNPFELDLNGRKPEMGLLNVEGRQLLDSMNNRMPIKIQIK